MKRFLLLFASAFPLLLSAQQRTDTLRGHVFHFQEIKTEDAVVLHVYREAEGKKKHLLEHTLESVSYDCNSGAAELGKYVCGDSTITFYTWWTHSSLAWGSPSGERKQVYLVSSDGKLRLAQSAVNVWREQTDDEGVRLLSDSLGGDYEKAERSIASASRRVTMRNG